MSKNIDVGTVGRLVLAWRNFERTNAPAAAFAAKVDAENAASDAEMWYARWIMDHGSEPGISPPYGISYERPAMGSRLSGAEIAGMVA